MILQLEFRKHLRLTTFVIANNIKNIWYFSRWSPAEFNFRHFDKLSWIKNWWQREELSVIRVNRERRIYVIETRVRLADRKEMTGEEWEKTSRSYFVQSVFGFIDKNLSKITPYNSYNSLISHPIDHNLTKMGKILMAMCVRY